MSLPRRPLSSQWSQWEPQLALLLILVATGIYNGPLVTCLHHLIFMAGLGIPGFAHFLIFADEEVGAEVARPR